MCSSRSRCLWGGEPHYFPWRSSCPSIFKQEKLLLKPRISLPCWFGNHTPSVCQLLVKLPSLLLQIHVRVSGQQGCELLTAHSKPKFLLGYHMGQCRSHRNSTEQSGTQTAWEERVVTFIMSQSVLLSFYTALNSPSLHCLLRLRPLLIYPKSSFLWI